MSNRAAIDQCINHHFLLDIEGAYECLEQEKQQPKQGQAELTQKISAYEEKISTLQSTVDKLRVSIKTIVDERDDDDDRPSSDGKDPSYENENYFSSYSHFAIHHEMLSDVARTTSYQTAILNNRNIFQNAAGNEINFSLADY